MEENMGTVRKRAAHDDEGAECSRDLAVPLLQTDDEPTKSCPLRRDLLHWAQNPAAACRRLVGVVGLLVAVRQVHEALNPNQHFGTIAHDYTKLPLPVDWDSLGARIDHWCLGGGGEDEDCHVEYCQQSWVPTSREGEPHWIDTVHDNQKLAMAGFSSTTSNNETLDVAIIGGSIVAAREGRWSRMARQDERPERLRHFFQKKTHDAPVEGITLGIDQDVAGNLLWRLRNGEMPNSLEPKVWWIVLGGLDEFIRHQCSEEVVVVGVLRVAMEILQKRPKARIVINSVLPMADLVPPALTTRIARTESLDNRGGSSNMSDDNGEESEPYPDRSLPRLHYSKDKVVVQDSSSKFHPPNPTINRARSQQKKYSLFGERQPLPLWTSIYAVNKELFKFAERHDRVDFFDATNLFARRKSGRHLNQEFTLLTDKISNSGRPTRQGFLEWEEAMVERVKMIVEREWKQEQPRLFLKEPP